MGGLPRGGRDVPAGTRPTLLSSQLIAANTEHAGIIVVQARFRGNEFQEIVAGIHEIVRQHPGGLLGSVVYLQRQPRD